MNYDVAVVGGGVIGSAAAYYLAKKGKRVLLLDKGTLITESSRAAAGMLAAPNGVDIGSGCAV